MKAYGQLNEYQYAAVIGLISYAGTAIIFFVSALWVVSSQRAQGNDITVASAWLFAGSFAVLAGVIVGWCLLKKRMKRAFAVSFVGGLTAYAPIVWLQVYDVSSLVIFAVVEPIVFMISFSFYYWYFNISLKQSWWSKLPPIIIGLVLYITMFYLYLFVVSFIKIKNLIKLYDNRDSNKYSSLLYCYCD